MLPKDFKRIVESFADDVGDIDLSRGKLIVQVRDELIEAEILQQEGALWVNEQGERRLAVSWLVDRVARLPLLAERIATLTNARDIEWYVPPSGRALERLGLIETNDEYAVDDAGDELSRMLDRRLVGSSSIVYLTSDAGEGKSTLLSRVAIEQAKKYKRKQTDWLVLPVLLGGRGFQRFDDAVIATLVNRYRFQMLYFEGFVELVKLGVLVPAFDGFEEVFIESGGGEAISALGQLVSQMDSSGSCIVAARNAYFEYKSFTTQASLFDAIEGRSASFGRLRLNRWDEAKFVAYARKRGLASPERLYAAVSSRYGTDYPLITRAVLARRLVDIALESGSVDALLDRLGAETEDFFFRFVEALISRESLEKWVDRSGEANRPLLTIEEHHELMASVAAEMWLASSDVLKVDVLDVVAEMFCVPLNRGPVVARQVKERIKQHTLLVNQDGRKNLYAFDHEDFRKFYLGEAVGRMLIQDDESEIKRFLSVAAIPRDTAVAAVAFASRDGRGVASAIQRLQSVAKRELQTSFVKENAGLLLLLLIERADMPGSVLTDLVFPPDALRGRRLTSASFESCHFQPTTLDGAVLENCSWTGCRFDRLSVSDVSSLKGARMLSCTFDALELRDSDAQIYEPGQILAALEERGVEVRLAAATGARKRVEYDDDARILERALRVFMRSTHVNESVFRQKLGARASRFLDHLVRRLIEEHVVANVQYAGAGVQARYRLITPMAEIQRALAECDGSFEGFLVAAKRKSSQRR